MSVSAKIDDTASAPVVIEKKVRLTRLLIGLRYVARPESPQNPVSNDYQEEKNNHRNEDGYDYASIERR